MKTEGIDYRRDTPPTDWLSKRIKTIRAKSPNPPSHKDLGLEFMSDLLEELDALRCQEPCPAQNGTGSSDTVATTLGTPLNDATQNGSEPTVVVATTDQPCICGLIDRISDLTGEWVPKDEFVAVLQPLGYTKDKALKKYSIYAYKKIKTKYSDEYKRLRAEGDNAYNWKREVGYEASGSLSEVIAELDELRQRCEAELAEIMSE